MSELEKLLKDAVLHEREECAKLCEEFVAFTGGSYCDVTKPDADFSKMHDYGRGGCDVRKMLATAIRRRTT